MREKLFPVEAHTKPHRAPHLIFGFESVSIIRAY